MATTAPARPLRADARRNRDAILAAARLVFSKHGIYAPTDTIATAAGVGNATLYRNFPTRDDLLASVIGDSIGELLTNSDALLDLDPESALREWLFEVTWSLRIWHDLPYCIAAAFDDDENPVQDTATLLTERTEIFLERARHAMVASDVTAGELVELVTAVSWGVDRYGDDEDRARRRVRLATGSLFTPAAS